MPNRSGPRRTCPRSQRLLSETHSALRRVLARCLRSSCAAASFRTIAIDSQIRSYAPCKSFFEMRVIAATTMDVRLITLTDAGPGSFVSNALPLRSATLRRTALALFSRFAAWVKLRCPTATSTEPSCRVISTLLSFAMRPPRPRQQHSRPASRPRLPPLLRLAHPALLLQFRNPRRHRVVPHIEMHCRFVCRDSKDAERLREIIHPALP